MSLTTWRPSGAMATLVMVALVNTAALATPAKPVSATKPMVKSTLKKRAPLVAAAVTASPVAPLGAAEQAIAANVYVGSFPCELGQSVDVQADDAAAGYFRLRLKNERFHLRPVVSSTGAVRLEDPAQGAVWIQLANKSMLMSQKLGRRLVDECMGPVQRAMAEELQRHPAPHLLDVAQSPRLD